MSAFEEASPGVGLDSPPNSLTHFSDTDDVRLKTVVLKLFFFRCPAIL